MTKKVQLQWQDCPRLISRLARYVEEQCAVYLLYLTRCLSVFLRNSCSKNVQKDIVAANSKLDTKNALCGKRHVYQDCYRTGRSFLALQQLSVSVYVRRLPNRLYQLSISTSEVTEKLNQLTELSKNDQYFSPLSSISYLRVAPDAGQESRR